MDWTSNLDQLLRQLSEVQRTAFTSWTSMMPTMQGGSSTPSFREGFDNTLKFQEEVVTNSLELQALLARLTMETQKQFWESYFNTLRRT